MLIKFCTVTLLQLAFSCFRNEHGCKVVNIIDFFPLKCPIYIVCKRGCKTVPCETIDITQ